MSSSTISPLIYDAVFKSKKNVFITAEGGAGKSFLLKQIYDHAIISGLGDDECILTSTTGVSAYNIGGQTIHSWSGILLPARMTELDDDSLRNAIQTIKERVKRNKRDKALRVAKLLLIDEVSMLGGYYLEMLDEVLRTFRKIDRPMGGLQIVTTGDLCQLPPVGDVFLFESEVWEEMKNTVFYLRTFYRFTDMEWTKLLSRCRVGELTKEDKKLLQSRVVGKDWSSPEGEIMPTLILPTNRLVEEVNARELDRINEELFYLQADDSVTSMDQEEVYNSKGRDIKNSLPTPELLTQEEIDKINSGFPIDRVLKMKVGCQVMLRKNLNVATGLVNGSRGIVLEIRSEDQAILVQFEQYSSEECSIPWNTPSLPVSDRQLALAHLKKKSPECEWIFPVTFSMQELKQVEKVEKGIGSSAVLLRHRKPRRVEDIDPLAGLGGFGEIETEVRYKRKFWNYNRRQYPLCLSAAISIHKSQGVTLNSIVVDVGSSIFSAGQSYVALSRCKSLSGVYLVHLDVNKIKADARAKRYDQQLRTKAIIIE